MATIVIAGLINLETTVRVEDFPVPYQPVQYPFYGVSTRLAGVGLNVAMALQSLGHKVRLLSLVGRDAAGQRATDEMAAVGLWTGGVVQQGEESAHSAILYDGTGRRAIFTDLKGIQEQSYPLERAEMAMDGCDAAILCNINFARPLLALARSKGLLIASDIHAIADLDDAYNRDWMASADILFMSHERLPLPATAWAEALMARFPTSSMVGIGMGAEGAMLARRDEAPLYAPAVAPRPIVSTVGAGDALFSAFLHGILLGHSPAEALRRATIFAGYKIGGRAGNDGFLTAAELERL